MATPFIFEVTKTWALDSANVHHLVGLLKEGDVVSGATAGVSDMPGVEVRIKSVVIAPSVGGDPRELTLSIERPGVRIADLVGKTLVSR